MKPFVEFRSPPSEELRKEIYEVYNQVFAIVKESIGIDPRERIQARFIVDTVPHVQACVSKFTEIHGGKCPYDEFLDGIRIWSFPLLCVEGHGLMEIEFPGKRESEDHIPEINYVLTSAGVLTWLLPHEFTEHYLIEELSLNPDASHARWLREGLGNYASIQATKKLQPSLYILMADRFRELLSQRTEANLIRDWPTDSTQEEFFYAASTLLLLHAEATGGSDCIRRFLKVTTAQKQATKEDLWRFAAPRLHISSADAGEFQWTVEMASRLLQ